MGDVVKFVDSIAASPTVRLDVNDEVKWIVRDFQAPPPQLRRAMSQNAMRDGVLVSSSVYDSRTVTLTLDLVTADQDTNATELQKLARELDRTDNFLMYQPVGATKPVFFRLFRSDMSQIENLKGPKALRRPTINLLAEPFALGLREVIATAATISSNPAAGTNPISFLTGTISGDAAPECVLLMTPSAANQYMVTAEGSGPALRLAQAETADVLGTDTTLPGADAAMSGAGSNYSRTTFATSAPLGTRLAWSSGIFQMPLEQYVKLLIRVRSSAAGTYQVKLDIPGIFSSGIVTVTFAAAGIQTVTLGTYNNGRRLDEYGYDVGTTSGLSASSTTIALGRTSGGGSLDVDFVVAATLDQGSAITAALPSGVQCIFDGVAGRAWSGFSASPIAFAGRIPFLIPGVNNRIYFTPLSGAISDTLTLTAYYWPRYLFVRPAAS